MSGLDTKLIAMAHEAIFERGPARDPHIDVLRRYAPHPLAPTRDEEPRYEDAEQFFLDEQCPSESFFGR